MNEQQALDAFRARSQSGTSGAEGPAEHSDWAETVSADDPFADRRTTRGGAELS